MLAFNRFTLRSLVAAGLIAGTTAVSQAQFTQPKFDTRPIPWNPQFQNPAFPWMQPNQQPRGNQPKNPILVMPSINTAPGIPASSIFRPAVSPPSWLNPAINNPWMNPVAVHPVRVNPFINPMFNNPFVANPLLRNPMLDNPFNVPGLFPHYGPSPLTTPTVTQTPPIAIQQPGTLIYKGLDLQVNPTTGTVYKPMSGVVTLADGTTFYRVPGTGLPTATGTYATGTGLYYNPDGNTFFNPSSGVISKPGQTNVFLPYVW